MVTAQARGRKTNMTRSETEDPICAKTVREGALRQPRRAGISRVMNKILSILAQSAVLAGAVAAEPVAASEVDPAFGYWLTENKKAIVRVDSCGKLACGTMVWVSEPKTEAGALKLDEKNEDTAKRDRPICGLPLFGGLAAAKPGRWDKGWLYNPRDGQTYSVQISAESSSKLKVRGFLGLPLLGSSQIWTRVDDDRGGCPTGAS